MGSKITDLLSSKEISIEDLRGKTLVVDAFNQLYMFLSSIRQPDGSLLKDSKGNVTSHLNGLFYRFTRLMQHDIKFIFVFDGKPPELKLMERKRRAGMKMEAELKYNEAKAKEDIEEMRKYAARTSKLTKEMLEDTKALLYALGIPVVQAPGEGEAQAAFMVRNKDAYASLSQDADSLLFGCPLVIKNLTISGRKKLPNKLSYDSINPELISLEETLKKNGITQDQLIIIAILTGTDYDIGGIRGIGPKTALKLVRQYPDNDRLFRECKWQDFFSYDWKEVFNIIKNTSVTSDYDVKFRDVDDDAVINILCNTHEFGEERVKKILESLHKKPKEQKGLNDWI